MADKLQTVHVCFDGVHWHAFPNIINIKYTKDHMLLTHAALEESVESVESCVYMDTVHAYTIVTHHPVVPANAANQRGLH